MAKYDGYSASGNMVVFHQEFLCLVVDRQDFLFVETRLCRRLVSLV